MAEGSELHHEDGQTLNIQVHRFVSTVTEAKWQRWGKLRQLRKRKRREGQSPNLVRFFVEPSGSGAEPTRKLTRYEPNLRLEGRSGNRG